MGHVANEVRLQSAQARLLIDEARRDDHAGDERGKKHHQHHDVCNHDDVGSASAPFSDNREAIKWWREPV